MSTEFDFEGVFNDDYIYFYSSWQTPEVTATQTEKIVALLDLQQGDQVLDLCCGYGRISIELAKRGIEVTGFDASKYSLKRAAEDATAGGVQLNLLLGDMRDLP